MVRRIARLRIKGFDRRGESRWGNGPECHKRRRLGVSPPRSFHAAGKQCPERRLVQFFNSRAACRLPVHKNAETTPMAPCEQKRDLSHKDQGD